LGKAKPLMHSEINLITCFYGVRYYALLDGWLHAVRKVLTLNFPGPTFLPHHLWHLYC